VARSKREQRMAARRNMVSLAGCVICKELYVGEDLFHDIVNEAHHLHGARVPRSLLRYVDKDWESETENPRRG
jgi:hypothetical protein